MDLELNQMCTTLACLRMQYETQSALDKGRWTPYVIQLWAAMGQVQFKVYERKTRIPDGKLAF